jgi:choline dehydrogenase-like flavoprotein
MHYDARTLPDNSVIEGDICIVGAGAAGISISLDWINSPYRVILLESGGFDYDDQVQDLYKGENTGQTYYPLRSNRLSYFGGTTNHWAGMCSPFDALDFKKRDWVPHSGWPISREDLDPFYARANKILKLGPYEYSLEYWQKQVPNLNPFPLDDRVIWFKMWQNSPLNGFKGGLKKDYADPILKAKNVHLYTYATAVDILTEENVSHVTELKVRNHAGKRHTVKARHFILAGGAIQNARMLLAASSQAPNGLGNDHDNVGRYFMEHLEIHAAELWLLRPFPTDLFTWSKIWCELAIREEVLEKNRILNGTAGPDDLAFEKNTPPRMETYQDDDPRKAVDNWMRSWDVADSLAKLEGQGAITRAYSLQTRLEQAPNPDSRVQLSQEKDALGMPRANLHWALTDLDKQSIRRINEIIGEEVGKAGFGRLKFIDEFSDPKNLSWPKGTNGGWHHMGTTRMSDDPRTGVVDKHCQVHGIDNLHVAGASCYATAGAPNPTLTLVALSLRLSDRIKARLEANA